MPLVQDLCVQKTGGENQDLIHLVSNYVLECYYPPPQTFSKVVVHSGAHVLQFIGPLWEEWGTQTFESNRRNVKL